MKKLLKFLPALVLMFTVCSCMDDERFATDARHSLTFSAETVSLDTVFTGISSFTAYFMVYNNTDAGLRFDARLAGGLSSAFRINLDGQGGIQMGGMEVGAGDSLMCFVSVNIPSSTLSTPFLERDSIVFVLESGRTQYVRLHAYGQNARRLNGYRIQSNETFTAELPYLIYDSLTVAENACLTLEPGTRLYFHDGAGLDVSGRILALGTQDSMIFMRGDRLDYMLPDLPYDLLDGQWKGVHLHADSYDNRFEFCDIHGGEFGILADSAALDRVKFSMHSSLLHTVAGNGIEATGCKIDVANSQITNAGLACVNLTGGASDFTFCTFADISLWNQGTSAVEIADCRGDIQVPFSHAYFNSCIITGRRSNELSVQLSDSAQYGISHSLVMAKDTTDTHFHKVVFETHGSDVAGANNFTSQSRIGYRSIYTLDSLSLARGIADTVSAVWPIDLAGVPRPPVGADAGCYQYHQ